MKMKKTMNYCLLKIFNLGFLAIFLYYYKKVISSETSAQSLATEE